MAIREHRKREKSLIRLLGTLKTKSASGFKLLERQNFFMVLNRFWLCTALLTFTYTVVHTNSRTEHSVQQLFCRSANSFASALSSATNTIGCCSRSSKRPRIRTCEATSLSLLEMSPSRSAISSTRTVANFTRVFPIRTLSDLKRHDQG
ncbi:hypothetical protein CPC08DRAFT_549556 [Agrocybe pediades]|nr:hypothetical protein CPC08DRAFT_558423 [Agrocybe pediades]KAF9537247.1 hypothetical protein CPC08DRAFT_549556 [Agrocybe pediades]